MNMRPSRWTLDQLKTSLGQRPEVKGWIITQEHLHRRERYFMSEGRALVTDQDREVHAENIQARIFVRLSTAGRQGEISQKLFRTRPLGEQLEMAVRSALQTDHQAWELPASSDQSPALCTADPDMSEDLDRTLAQVTAEIAEAVASRKDTTFNSAELFLSLHQRELHLSTGIVHRSAQSRIYTEAAYSATAADEYLNTRWAVSRPELSVRELFDETADRALRTGELPKPESGKYAVILDAEVLSTLLNGYLSQLSAANCYQGLPFVKPGSELIPEATGDLIHLTLDPTLEYGADSAAISEQGVPQKPLLLVDRNRVLATLTDKQHADYLGIPATTVRGNLVLATGSVSYDELTRSAPRVLEVLQFSGLFADPNSGTFSSEIRLARLFDQHSGAVTYLRGGSLSGSITENFRGLRLGKQNVRRAHFSSDHPHGQGYEGPSHALITDVSIVS